MPRGVYDRTKMKKREPAGNGSQPAAFSPTIEAVDDLAPTPSSRNGINWGQPYEVSAADLEPVSPWEDLYDDAVLRLERTPAGKAIVYPFEDEHTADQACEAIRRRMRKRNGSGFARCGFRRTPPRMFVRRGPNYKKG